MMMMMMMGLVITITWRLIFVNLFGVCVEMIFKGELAWVLQQQQRWRGNMPPSNLVTGASLRPFLIFSWVINEEREGWNEGIKGVNQMPTEKYGHDKDSGREIENVIGSEKNRKKIGSKNWRKKIWVRIFRENWSNFFWIFLPNFLIFILHFNTTPISLSLSLQPHLGPFPPPPHGFFGVKTLSEWVLKGQWKGQKSSRVLSSPYAVIIIIFERRAHDFLSGCNWLVFDREKNSPPPCSIRGSTGIFCRWRDVPESGPVFKGHSCDTQRQWWLCVTPRHTHIQSQRRDSQS